MSFHAVPSAASGTTAADFVITTCAIPWGAAVIRLVLPRCATMCAHPQWNANGAAAGGENALRAKTHII